MDKKRSFNIAYVNAELKAKLAVAKFEKEFENANQNQQGNQATGNVPQQPQYNS